MTKREIAKYISDHSCLIAARLDIGKLCKDNGFRPYDVSEVKIVCNQLLIIFKNYFKYDSISIPFEKLGAYYNSSAWFWCL